MSKNPKMDLRKLRLQDPRQPKLTPKQLYIKQGLARRKAYLKKLLKR